MWTLLSHHFIVFLLLYTTAVLYCDITQVTALIIY